MKLSAPQLKVQLISRGKYPIGAFGEFLPYISGASASYYVTLPFRTKNKRLSLVIARIFFSNPVNLVHMLSVSYKVQTYFLNFIFPLFKTLLLTAINTGVPHLPNANTVQWRTQKSKLIIF